VKQSRLTCVLTSVACVTLLASCQKKVVMPTTNNPDIDSQGSGIFILNQGNGFGSNIKYNSSLTYYNQSTKTLIADEYSVANTIGIVIRFRTSNYHNRGRSTSFQGLFCLDPPDRITCII
jgi:hypothetical protein